MPEEVIVDGKTIYKLFPVKDKIDLLERWELEYGINFPSAGIIPGFLTQIEKAFSYIYKEDSFVSLVISHLFGAVSNATSFFTRENTFNAKLIPDFSATIQY
jgi:hypothetical protein